MKQGSGGKFCMRNKRQKTSTDPSRQRTVGTSSVNGNTETRLPFPSSMDKSAISLPMEIMEVIPWAPCGQGRVLHRTALENARVQDSRLERGDDCQMHRCVLRICRARDRSKKANRAETTNTTARVGRRAEKVIRWEQSCAALAR